MTNNESILSNITYYEEPTPVYLGDKSTVMSHGEGQLRLRTYCEEGTCLALKQVLLVPKLMKVKLLNPLRWNWYELNISLAI